MEIQNCIAVEQFTEEIKGKIWLMNIQRKWKKFSGNGRNLAEMVENQNLNFKKFLHNKYRTSNTFDY